MMGAALTPVTANVFAFMSLMLCKRFILAGNRPET